MVDHVGPTRGDPLIHHSPACLHENGWHDVAGAITVKGGHHVFQGCPHRGGWSHAYSEDLVHWEDRGIHVSKVVSGVMECGVLHAFCPGPYIAAAAVKFLLVPLVTRLCFLHTMPPVARNLRRNELQRFSVQWFRHTRRRRSRAGRISPVWQLCWHHGAESTSPSMGRPAGSPRSEKRRAHRMGST